MISSLSNRPSTLSSYCLSVCCFLVGSNLLAAERETREYRVFADGKPAGSYTMVIEKRDDGTLVQSARADVAIRILLKNYTYSYRGTETWKDGRLLRADTTANDDGNSYRLAAEADTDAIRVTANNRNFKVAPHAWTMTYWQPPRSRQEGPITLLDVDTGKVHEARLRALAAPSTPINGQQIQMHLQVTGPVFADLLYDGRDRLVRQETTEGGHKTVIELVRVAK